MPMKDGTGPNGKGPRRNNKGVPAPKNSRNNKDYGGNKKGGAQGRNSGRCRK